MALYSLSYSFQDYVQLHSGFYKNILTSTAEKSLALMSVFVNRVNFVVRITSLSYTMDISQ